MHAFAAVATLFVLILMVVMVVAAFAIDKPLCGVLVLRVFVTANDLSDALLKSSPSEQSARMPCAIKKAEDDDAVLH